MDSVLEYAKVPVTIQSYAKAQSYAKTTGKYSEPKDTRRFWSHAAMAATVSCTSEELSGLKLMMTGHSLCFRKFYPLKAFVLEEIYLEKLPEFFRDLRRDKKMDQSTKTDETRNNKSWLENNR